MGVYLFLFFPFFTKEDCTDPVVLHVTRGLIQTEIKTSSAFYK